MVEEAPRGQAPPPKPPRRSRRLRPRIAVYGFIGLVCAAIALWLVPFRAAWLDRAVSRAFEDVSGSRVTFASVRCFLAQGLIEIEDLSFAPLGPSPSFLPSTEGGRAASASPTSTDPALTPESAPSDETVRCRRARVYFNLREALWGSQNRVKSLVLIDPSVVGIRVGAEGGATLGPWRHFWDRCQRRREGRASEDLEGPLPRLDVKGLEIQLEGSHTGSVPAKTVMSGASLSLEIGETRGFSLVLRGARVNGLPNHWSVRASRAGHAARTRYSAAWDRMVLPLGAGSRGEGQSATLALESPRLFGRFDAPLSGASVISGAVSFTAREAAIRVGHVAELADTDVSIEVDWRYVGDKRRVEIRRLAAAAKASEARLEGALTMGTSPTFEAVLDVYDLPRGALPFAARQLGLPAERFTFADDSRLVARGVSLAGALTPTEVTLRSIEELSIAGMTARLLHESVAIPAIVRDCQAKLSYGPGRIALTRLSGAVKGGRLELSGEVLGDVLSPGLLKGEFSWRADLDVQDYWRATQQANGQLLGGLEAAGTVTAFGRITQKARREPSGRWTFEASELMASVKVTSGALAHPKLALPMDTINGFLTSHGDSLVVSDLSGRIGGVEAVFAGKIQGDGFFWMAPKLKASVCAKTTVENALGLVPASWRERLEPFEPCGQAQIDARIQADLPGFENLRTSGAIHLSDAGFHLDERFVTSPVRSLSGTILVERDGLRGEGLQGSIGGIAFTCGGSVTSQSASLLLAGDVDLKAAQRLAPRGLRFFDVDGRVKVEARLRLDPTFVGAEFLLPTEESLRSLLEAETPPTASAPPVASAASGLAPREPRFWVRLEGAGLRFTHENMPGAMENLRGEILFADGIFFSQKLKGDFGQSKDITARRLLISLQKKDHIELSFDLEAPNVVLDEWFVPWRRRPRGSQLDLPEAWRREPWKPGPRPPRKKSVKIEGRIHASQAKWKQHDFTDLDLRIAYGHSAYGQTPDSPPRTEIRATGRAYDGATSQFLLFQSDGKGRFRWESETSLENVAVKPLVAKMRKAPEAETNIDGRLTGHLRLEGAGKDKKGWVGDGRFRMDQSSLIGNVLFKRLDLVLKNVTKLGGLFTNASLASFTEASTDVEIAKGRIGFPNLLMENERMKLAASGTVGFDKSLDMSLDVSFFKRPGILTIPIIKQVTDVLAGLKREALRFGVKGTLDDPKPHIAIPFSKSLTGSGNLGAGE